MTLNPQMWDQLYSYLVIDQKHDDSQKNVQRRKSVFLIMCKYFEEKEFTRDNFNTFIRYLLEKGYSKEYANSFIKLAKHIDKCFKINELSDYTMFPRVPKIVDVLSYTEIKEMAEVHIPYPRESEERNYREKCIIMTLLLTGARITEVLSLRWENIRDNPPCLVIEQNKTRDYRIAPVTNELIEMFHKLPKTSGYIFASRSATIPDSTSINDAIKRRALAIGVNKRVYNHLIRHSFVNFMLRSGTPMHIVSRMVGHKDIATTNEYYTHIMIEEMSDFLHTYHPHLKDTQTLVSIKKRVQHFCETFINKNKFDLNIEEKKNKVYVEIKEL